MNKDQVKDIIQNAARMGVKIVTAESCTGGMLATALTSVPGASEVFECGFITYSYESKSAVLRVDPGLIHEHGAVSSEVAIEMALGAARITNCDMAISITGIAGPGGATADKPIGLVYFAILFHGEIQVFTKRFDGDRHAVRSQSVDFALSKINETMYRAEHPIKAEEVI